MQPIPGTANISHLEENMAAARIQLSPEEWKKIKGAVKDGDNSMENQARPMEAEPGQLVVNVKVRTGPISLPEQGYFPF